MHQLATVTFEPTAHDWKCELKLAVAPMAPETTAAAVTAHIEGSLTFEQLVFGWLTSPLAGQTNRQVEMFTDDTEGSYGRFCILFLEAHAAVVEASLSEHCARGLYSGELVTAAIANPYSEAKRAEWMKRRHSYLNMQFDERLPGEVVDIQTALSLAFSYSLTMGGFTALELLDNWSREPFKEWDENGELANNQIIFANYMYREDLQAAKPDGKGTAFGWGESYYLIF